MPPRFADHPDHVAAVISAVLEAVNPRTAVAKALSREPIASDWPVIAIGKAAIAMAHGAIDSLPNHHAPSIIIAPTPSEIATAHTLPPHMHVLHAEHPLPGEGSLAAGAALTDFAIAIARDPAAPGVLVLISGGASSLVCAPVDGISLDDIRSISKALMLAGADIASLNAVRRELDQLKGGGLARILSPLPIRAMVISDVIGDAPHDIASGPVSPNPTSAADALRVLDFYQLRHAAPAVTAYLERRTTQSASAPATPEFGSCSCFLQSTSTYQVIVKNADARSAAALALMGLGFPAPTQRVMLGSADSLGRHLATQAAMLFNQAVPAAAIVGGETTVTVPPDAGFGGRNQHAALVAALALSPTQRAVVFTFSTDGVDGLAPPNSPPAAGAIVNNTAVARSRSMGIEPLHFLRRCDSYSFFARLDERLRAAGTLRAGEQPSHILTGPTGTNVNDIAVVMCYRT